MILDYVRPNYERKCHIIGENRDVKWNFINKKSAWKNYKKKALSKIRINSVGKEKEKIQQKVVIINEMYEREIKNFLGSIINEQKLLVDGNEGLKTLKIGLAAIESSNKNKIIKIKD